MQMSVRIFLTGAPGCGKSTVVQNVLARLRVRGVRVAGVLTPETRRAGAAGREGFEIIDIASGTKGVMASVGVSSPYRVSKYGVDVAAIDKIVAASESSISEADAVIIDEIGKMEFFSEKFRMMLEKVLASKKPLLATLHRAMVKDFERRGEVIQVTAENREKLPAEILERLKI